MDEYFRHAPSDDLDDTDTMANYEDCAPGWGETGPRNADHVLLARFFYPEEGVSYYGTLKRWNGSSWVAARLRRYNGSAWVDTALKIWYDGDWQLIDTTGG